MLDVVGSLDALSDLLLVVRIKLKVKALGGLHYGEMMQRYR